MTDNLPDSPDESSAEDTNPRKRRRGRTFGCLGWGLVVYLLSPPLFMMVIAFFIDYGEFGVPTLTAIRDFVYAPIDWLTEHVTPVRTFYDWYLGFFEAWFEKR